MSKPFATAIIDGSPFGHGGPERIVVRRSSAQGAQAQFHAPGWRAMAFRSVEAAKAKAERHPGFQRWAT